jgi:hypothetical protein
VNLTLALGGPAHRVNITMEGPADVWFGVGFDTQFMSNSPYTITVDGSGAVVERVRGLLALLGASTLRQTRQV